MEGSLMRTLRLVDLAFAAKRAGDEDLADRLFAEAERIGPAELAMASEDEAPIVARHH